MVRRESLSTRVPEELDVEGLRVAVLVARFNEDITRELLAGARACLQEAGVSADAVDVYFVPGAWELPQAASRVLATGEYDALVALGCVIRGETPHFDFISAEAARGLGAVARTSTIPVAFGVLTTDTVAQARERADRKGQDKGREAALAALEMVGVYRQIRHGSPGGGRSAGMASGRGESGSTDEA
ncbi:MAG: 6,7-dimethyl-8-ribityllumazine synthase [Longimicrobiales bacterium]|nr:6,7-dimethyl-8-ribityllumazine synthase [Longimicrobiales bacterium]